MDKQPTNSVKQSGPIHMVFSGKHHIGNVIAPTIGGSREGAQHFTAISKFWGIKKNHDSKMAALQWLKQQHGEPMKMESVKKKPSAYEYTTNLALTPKGMVKEDDWKEDIIVAIQESVVNYRDRISKMSPPEINQHYQGLYQAHLRTGMAPRYFKSPMHLAQIEERDRNIPVGSLSKYVAEDSNWVSGNAADPEMDTVGVTGHTEMDRKRKLKIRKVVRKHPDTATATLDTINGQLKVSEAYLIVMDKKKAERAAAKAANDNKPPVKEELFDKDVNQKDPKAGPQPKENETGDMELQIKKTATGKPGDIIAINPKMKIKKTGTDYGGNEPEHKGKVGTTS